MRHPRTNAYSFALLTCLASACGTDSGLAPPSAKAEHGSTSAEPQASGAPALGANTTGSGPALAIASPSVLPDSTLPQPNASGSTAGGGLFSNLLGGGGGGNILGSLSGAVGSLTGGLGIGNITGLLGGIGGAPASANATQQAAGSSIK